MARDISQRLDALRRRRTGLDRLDSLAMDARDEVLAKSLATEAWQTRAPTSQPNTRYALGAMQEVGPDYTRISIETAVRVGKQLEAGLAALGYETDHRLQGSVPLNVHIRGVSDVDLLTLRRDYFLYATAGPLGRSGAYGTPSLLTPVQMLSGVRVEAEKILRAKFPAAKVDCSGAKAIKISGGSLPRSVDSVPALWWETVAYQQTGQAHERGVVILDKKKLETINNLPFLHIKRVDDRDLAANGGLKKAIRLAKSVKSDAEAEGTTIALSSFDIAGALYHANLGALASGRYNELAILVETQRHLDWLTQNEMEAQRLLTPDASRAVFNTGEKLTGLRRLSLEFDDLLTEVAKEQDRRLVAPSWSDSRMALGRAFLPAS